MKDSAIRRDDQKKEPRHARPERTEPPKKPSIMTHATRNSRLGDMRLYAVTRPRYG